MRVGVSEAPYSAGDAALGVFDEMYEVLHFWVAGGGAGLEGAEAVGEADFLFQEKAFVSGFQVADIGLREAAALEANEVQAAGGGGVPINDHEGRDVLDDFRESADDRVFPDSAELVDGGEAGDDRVVFHGDVSGEAAVVGKNDVISKLAIVSDVGVAEEEIVRADAGG